MSNEIIDAAPYRRLRAVPNVPQDFKRLPRQSREPTVPLSLVIVCSFVALLALAGPVVAVSGLAAAFLFGLVVWR